MDDTRRRQFLRYITVALIGAGVLWFWLFARADTTRGAGERAQADRSPEPSGAIYASDPVPDIAARVRPAVVQVLTTVMEANGRGGETEAAYGSGSGVYIDSRGYFVTNKHVIDGGDRVYIVTLSGNRYPARVRGSDDGADLAVLYAEADMETEPVAVGDSDLLRVGELVVAIGNPGGSDGSVLFGTLTTGVVSALNRTELSAGNFSRVVSVIQTDAAINSGNSGGALLNSSGELIGIPTLKLMYDTGSVYEGLGFAIPINTAKPIIDEIIEKGGVSRPRLGISAAARGGEEEGGSAPPAGVQVFAVEPNSAAQAAGIRAYDILTHADGARIRTVQDLAAIIDTHAQGESVRLTVARFFGEDGSLLASPSVFETSAPIRVS